MAQSRMQNGQPANYNTTPATRTSGDSSALEVDSVGNLKTSAATTTAGEDITNDVEKVEQRFSYGTESSADQLQKTGAGFLHAVVYSCTVAGDITIRDATAAGGGTIIKTLNLVVGTGSIIFDCSFATGLFVDFGTITATVNTSHR